MGQISFGKSGNMRKRKSVRAQMDTIKMTKGIKKHDVFKMNAKVYLENFI